ncbi:MAG: hypothetical protein FWB74_01755 [Defluviitaleaceae bacterium]|nr:hypothetical protein [Defluviitaleaceae bacterium]
MASSIKGYNEAARQGKKTALEYCEKWQKELKVAGINLAKQVENKTIGLAAYNKLRAELNERTKDLNACIKSINRQFV